MLKPDPLDTTNALLLLMYQQMANASLPLQNVDPPEQDAWTVRVNVFFTASFSLSLVSVLMAMLAKQCKLFEHPSGCE